MCTILFSYRQHADFPFLLAANRDEFYARPTRPMGFWPECPILLAGMDLREGGTWLGLSRRGRFAAITNFREPENLLKAPRSRGELVAGFLRAEAPPEEFLAGISDNAQLYGGFNLVAGDASGLWYLSNRSEQPAPQKLEAGLYGLSNQLLDTPWHKVQTGKQALGAIVSGNPNTSKLLAIMADRTRAPESRLPRTGVSRRLEQMLSSRFIRSPLYGTRASTALLIGKRGHVIVSEQSFGRMGRPGPHRDFRLNWPDRVRWHDPAQSPA